MHEPCTVLLGSTRAIVLRLLTDDTSYFVFAHATGFVPAVRKCCAHGAKLRSKINSSPSTAFGQKVLTRATRGEHLAADIAERAGQR